MAVKFDALNQEHIAFIANQHLFFIGSAGCEGFINVSPKGMDTLKVIDGKKIVWLNHTGSGNETSTHVQENGRMTIMWCSFDKKPLILKAYGSAKVIHPRDASWDEMCGHFEEFLGVRQFFVLDISLVLASCGFGVPKFKYIGERNSLLKWANNVGREGISEYWEENNQISLDGKETHIL